MALPDQFAFNRTVAALGSVDIQGAPLAETGFVGLDGVHVPGGTLFVCPHEGTEQDEVPPLPVLEERCREEDRFDEPEFSIGGRTWIQTTATLEASPLEGTVSMFWLADELQLAATLPDSGLEAGLGPSSVFAFTPTRASSEILVEEPGQSTWYNGTDWVFYLEEASSVRVQADGMHANVTAPATVELSSASMDAFRSANQPRVLLDVQEAALGPSEREPVSNLTSVFQEHGRIPQLTNGALLGSLEASFGDNQLDPEQVSLVRVDQARLEQSEETLEGEADVLFVRSGQSFAPGTGQAPSVPWLLVAALWVGAGVAVALWDRGKRPSWHRFLGAPLGVLAFLAWDGALYRTVGTSAIQLAFGEATLGEWLAVFGFELVALGVAWLLVYLPGRVILERGLPEGFSAWARPAWALMGVILILASPGTMVALGTLVARL